MNIKNCLDIAFDQDNKTRAFDPEIQAIRTVRPKW